MGPIYWHWNPIEVSSSHVTRGLFSNLIPKSNSWESKPNPHSPIQYLPNILWRMNEWHPMIMDEIHPSFVWEFQRGMGRKSGRGRGEGPEASLLLLLRGFKFSDLYSVFSHLALWVLCCCFSCSCGSCACVFYLAQGLSHTLPLFCLDFFCICFEDISGTISRWTTCRYVSWWCFLVSGCLFAVTFLGLDCVLRFESWF